MLDPKTLEAIKNASKTASESQIIHIEVGNGFAYGSVTISSAGNKPVIQELSTELEWTFQEGGTQKNPCMMHRTSEEFKDGATALSIGEAIRDDLEAKGYSFQFSVKAYR
jgi:hypothetical protein